MELGTTVLPTPSANNVTLRGWKPRWRWYAPGLLFLILAVELFVPAAKQSQTPDEANHILAGVRYLKYHDFGTNPEHPPLAKMVAAIPLLGIPAPAPAPFTQFFKGENFSSGMAFLYTHDADSMLLRSRMAVSIFTFALAALVFAAGCEMFGPATGLIALLLLVFEPNVLAHGAIVTTDMAATCWYFGSAYAFFRWCRRPTPLRLIVSGCTVGLALAAKHSSLLLIPVMVLLACIELLHSRSENKSTSRSQLLLRTVAGMAVVVAIAYGMLWAFYGFRYQARPGNLAMVPTLSAYTETTHQPLVNAVIPRLAAWHVLPESYLFGAVDIAIAAKRDPMFLLGTDYATGHWFYFPVALLIKSTLPLLVLLSIAPFLRELWASGKRRAMAFLLVPSLSFVGVSLASTMDIGIRHILPVFPFLILIAAAAVRALARKGQWGVFTVTLLVLAHVVSSSAVFPNYLTYANEAWGGPSNTYRLLTDSNADWNQGLRAAKRYLDNHGIRDCWFAHYGWDVDPAYYHIPCKPLPEALSHMFGQPLPPVPVHIEGTILVSGSEADGDYWGPGDLNPYAQFLYRKPDALIANSILVFHGRFDVPVLSSLAHMSHARQFAGRQQWDNALGEARVALDLTPNSAEAHAVLGNILFAMGRKDDAQKAFQEALALAATDYPEFQKARILHIPAEFYGL